MLDKLNKKLHTPTWLFILLGIVLILRIPSFFEPYSYGDEMIYLALGEAIRQRIPLYSGIHDNKPPLLYVTAAVAGSLFWFKAILAVWHIITVFIFWKFTEALFPKKKNLHKVATIVFAIFTTIPLFEGNIANAELFMLGPTFLAFYLLLTKKLTSKNLLISGVLFSISTLYKVPAAFDVPAIVFYWLATTKLSKKNLIAISKRTLVLAVGFAVPIFLTFLFYSARCAFFDYLVAGYLQNFGYLSSWRPSDVREPFLVRNLPLIQRGVLVLVGLMVLYWKRTKISKQFLFITGWLLLTLFAVTLSERPYPHYLLQSVPAVSLLVGMLFTLNNIEQVLTILPLTLFSFVPFYFNFWYYPTTPYYTNFVKFATNQRSRQEYFDKFGGNVNRNYKVAETIIMSTQKKDKVFVWGDSSAIYALSRRLPPIKYVADYHINDFSSKSETIKSLSANPPEMIVILNDAPDFIELEGFLENKYILVEEFDQNQFWSLFGSNLRSLARL